MSGSLPKTAKQVINSVSATMNRIIDTIGPLERNPNTLHPDQTHQPVSASPTLRTLRRLTPHPNLNFQSLPALQASPGEPDFDKTDAITSSTPKENHSASVFCSPTPPAEQSSSYYTCYPSGSNMLQSPKPKSESGFRQLVLPERLTSLKKKNSDETLSSFENENHDTLFQSPVSIYEAKKSTPIKSSPSNTSTTNESFYSVGLSERRFPRNGLEYDSNGNDRYYSAPPTQFTSHQPYIGFGARLSQIWINSHTIFLILIIVKITSFTSTLHMMLNAAQSTTEDNCDAAESMVSHALATPQDLAYGATVVLEKGVEYSVKALMSLFYILFRILEEIAFFALSTLIGTYACLITAAVNEVADVGLTIAEDVIGFANKTVSAVVTGLEESLGAVEMALSSVTEVINQIHGVFDNKKNKDTFTIENININLSGLKNLSIPASVNDSIEKLRSKVPDYTTVTNKTKEVISIPFSALFREINKTMTAENIAYNRSAVTLPPQPTVLFCSASKASGSTPSQAFFKLLHTIIHDTCKVLVILLILAAILVCLPVAWRELRRWIWFKSCAERAAAYEFSIEQNASHYDNSTNRSTNKFSSFFNSNRPSSRVSRFMTVIIQASHHWTSKFQDLVAKHVGNPKGDGSGIGPGNTPGNSHKKVMARWWVEYISYQPALSVLFLGFCGLVIVILQFIIFFKIKHAYQHAISGQDHATSVLSNNNILSFGQGETSRAIAEVEAGIDRWTFTANSEMHRVQDQVNDHLLGWVHDATGHINDSLTVFYDSMNEEIANVFNGTVFYNGISNIVYCTIGSKVEAIQKGIRWIHSNTYINMPNVTADMIIDSSQSSIQTFKSSNSSAWSNNTLYTTTLKSASADSVPAESKMDTLVAKAKKVLQSGIIFVLNYTESNILQELYISLALMGAWLFVAVTGYIYCAVIVLKETNKSESAALAGYDGSSPGGPNAPKNRGLVGYILRGLGTAIWVSKTGSKVMLGPVGSVVALGIGTVASVVSSIIVGISNLFNKRSQSQVTELGSNGLSNSPKKTLGAAFQFSRKINKRHSDDTIQLPQHAATRPNKYKHIPGIDNLKPKHQPHESISLGVTTPTGTHFVYTDSLTPTKYESAFIEKISSPPRPLKNANVLQSAVPLSLISHQQNASFNQSPTPKRSHAQFMRVLSKNYTEAGNKVPEFRNLPLPLNDSFFSPNLNEKVIDPSVKDEPPMTPLIPSMPTLDLNYRNSNHFSTNHVGPLALNSNNEVNETKDTPKIGLVFNDDALEDQNRKRKVYEPENFKVQSPPQYQKVATLVKDWSTGSLREGDGIQSFYDSSSLTPTSSRFSGKSSTRKILRKPPTVGHLWNTTSLTGQSSKLGLDSPILGTQPHGLFGNITCIDSLHSSGQQTPVRPIDFGITPFTPPGYNGEPPKPVQQSFQVSRTNKYNQSESKPLYGNLRLNDLNQVSPYSRSPLSPVTPRYAKSPRRSTFHKSPADPFTTVKVTKGNVTKQAKVEDPQQSSQVAEDEDLIVIEGSAVDPNSVTPKRVARNKRPSVQTSPENRRKSHHVTVCYSPC